MKRYLFGVLCGLLLSFLWVQAASNSSQANNNAGILNQQGATGPTQPVGGTGYTGPTGFTPNTTMPSTNPGLVPGTTPAPGSTGFTGYTGGPPR